MSKITVEVRADEGYGDNSIRITGGGTDISTFAIELEDGDERENALYYAIERIYELEELEARHDKLIAAAKSLVQILPAVSNQEFDYYAKSEVEALKAAIIEAEGETI